MGLVIDTSALVALERSGADWPAALGSYASEAIALPAAVYGELLVGVSLAGNRERARKRRARIEALVDVTGIVDFDASIAEHWAELFALLSKRGHLIPSNHLAVAATARFLDFGVLVDPHDERHFRGVPDLHVVLIGH
ncbi:MAG TPA: PIN domain-containing protein [Gemmatimonadaceae bacterium]